MRLTRVKKLLAAPKNAEQLFIVVTPSRLSLDKDGNWKDNRDTFSVEVWLQKGDDEPTQENMGDYAVHIFKNGSSTVSVIKRNTTSFSVQAAKTDKSFDVRLKVGDAFVQTVTVDVTQDGATGTPGGNTATVVLYKRSTTEITARDWTHDCTYTFTTKALSPTPSGWTLNKIPEGTDPIYVTAATAYSTGATDTIAATEWATPVLLAENGDRGNDGLNTASVFLYKRSVTTPEKPQGQMTYTFATASLVGDLSGWSLSIPETDGNPCWVIQATAVSTLVRDIIEPTEWSEPKKLVVDGSNGLPGGNTATLLLYKRSGVRVIDIDWKDTCTYTFAAKTLNPTPSGWTLNKIPEGTAPVYVTAATAYSTGATDAISASEWAKPVLFVENGNNGLNTAPVFLYMRSNSTPAKPSYDLTYTFATGELSGELSGWSQKIPETDGNPCWVIQATAISSEDTDEILSTEWSDPVKMVADGDNGTPGGNTATLLLFKRSKVAVAGIDWNTYLIYDFANKSLDVTPTGWTLNKIPEGTEPIYVTAATAFSLSNTDYIYYHEWSTPVLFAQNGEQGLNSASVFLYKRSASIPSKPTVDLTYNFATGELSGELSGWSQTIPETDGNPCWVIQATAISTGLTDVILSTEWSEQKKLVVDGESGNGITDERTYYLATTMASGVTKDTDRYSWTTTYQAATADKPYVWRYKVTWYSDGTAKYTDCELVFSYSGGSNSNLLEQTNFSSVLAMDKWTTRSKYVRQDGYSGILPEVTLAAGVTTGLQARNAYHDECDYGTPSVKHKIVLEQPIKAGGVSKIEPSTWYTLSFWMKAAMQDTLYLPVALRRQAVYGFCGKTLRLTQGKRYTISAFGYVDDATQGQMMVEVLGTFSGYNESYRMYTSSTLGELKSVTFTAAHTGTFTIKTYSYKSEGVAGGLVTILYYAIKDEDGILETLLYPSCVDTAAQALVDGEAVYLEEDGRASWRMASEWVQHTLTFRTKESIGDEDQYLQFRMLPSVFDEMTRGVSICMPKLEVGMQATGYLSNDASIHTGQPRRRRWAINTEYMAGGVDEPYLDAVLFVAGAETVFFRCIKSHVSTDDNKPTGTYGSQYWTSENSVHFENLSTDLFFATKAYVDNLIATLIQTGYEGSPHIEAEGSEFKIFGRGQYPAIYLAVNSDNKAVLRFQNENTGEFLYDLGPDGIMKEFTEVADSYTKYSLHKLKEAKRVSELLDITDSMCTNYYRFNEGYKQIGTGSTATKEYHVSGTSSPSAKNASYFTVQSYSGSTIKDGWYCKANNGVYRMLVTDFNSYTTLYTVNICQFSGGKLISSITVYFKDKTTSYELKSVGCDEKGNELDSTTYPYLYSYGLSISKI